MVGLTWTRADVPEDGTVVWLRTRSDKGWGAWVALDVTRLSDPAQSREMRYGTEPIWVPGTTKVQVRVSPHQRAATAKARVSAITPPAVRELSSASGATISPTVITRAQWRADESLKTCTGPVLDTNVAMVVHHAADPNTYTAAESASIVRSIYAYHVRTMGWCDMGYNMLVDRYGQVFEGRYGGIDRPVLGAHALGFNYQTFSVSVMGNFTSTAPPTAAIDSLVNVLSRRACAFYLDASSTVVLTSRDDGTRYPSGTQVSLPVIFGHRDVNYTTCPGDYLYALLPSIRTRVASFVNPMIPRRPRSAFNVDLNGTPMWT